MNEKSISFIEPYLDRPIKAGDNNVTLEFALKMQALACPADPSTRESNNIAYIKSSLEEAGSLSKKESAIFAGYISELLKNNL